MLKKMIELIAASAVLVFVTGCGSKEAKTITHHDSGSCALIVSDIYDECMADNDIQGAKEV